MSPLVAAPSRGYADWQRVDNWDSPTLWNVTPSIGNAIVQSPIIDVSRFAYLSGVMEEDTSQCVVDLRWLSASSGGSFIGFRTFVLSTLIPNFAYVRVPNLGPFLQIQVSPIAAANFEFSATLLGTNRVHPLEFIPRNPTLIDKQAQTVGAGAAATVYPGDYYAGPMRIWATCGATYSWALYFLNTVGVWDFVEQIQTQGASVNSSVNTVAPPGAWRVVLTNTGAANANYWLCATPSTTGAT